MAGTDQVCHTCTVAFLQHLEALPTRDAIIVILSLLAMAKKQGKKISELANSLPARFCASNRIKEFPTEKSKSCITRLIANNDDLAYQAIEAAFGELFGKVKNMDLIALGLIPRGVQRKTVGWVERRETHQQVADEYPVRLRQGGLLVTCIANKHWLALKTYRATNIRIISARRSRQSIIKLWLVERLEEKSANK